MKLTTKLAYGGAALGIAIANLLPLILPETSSWAPTAGIVVGLLIIFGADGEAETGKSVASQQGSGGSPGSEQAATAEASMSGLKEE